MSAWHRPRANRLLKSARAVGVLLSACVRVPFHEDYECGNHHSNRASMGDDNERTPDEWLFAARIADTAGRSKGDRYVNVSFTCTRRTADAWRALVRMCSSSAHVASYSMRGTDAVRMRMKRYNVTLTDEQLGALTKICRRALNERRAILRYCYEVD